MTLRIGRTIAESTPAFDPLPRRPEGSPNVVVVVLDDLGFGQLGCFGSDIATPDDRRPRRRRPALQPLPRHVAVLADAGVPADRAQPPRRRHGLPHRHPDRLPRLQRPHPAVGGARCPASCATRATARSPSASGTSRPAGSERASGPFDRWPLGFGFERYYGFLGGDTNQWAPELVQRQPLRRAARGAPRRATTSPRTSPTGRSAMVLDQQQATPGKPFFLYFATGAMHAPHHVAPEWVERYRGRFDHGWERWRDERSPARARSGSCRAGTHAHRAAELGAGLGRASPTTSAGSTRGSRRCSPASSRTPTRRSAGSSTFLDELGQLDNTLVMLISDNGASAEGGPLGSLNEHRFTARHAGRPRRLHGAHRRARRLPRVQPLRMGLGVGGQHAVAAVEALHVARAVCARR